MEDMELLTAQEARAEIKRYYSEPEPEKRPLAFPADQIKSFPSLFQPRTNMEAWHVEEMKETALERGKDLDPVDILLCGSTPVLVDGHHRLAAYLGHSPSSNVPVQYLELSVDEAVEHSIRENCKSKIAISSTDRQNTAWRLVCELDEKGSPKYSKSKLVDLTGVSDGTVASMRRVLKTLGDEASEHTEWHGAMRAAKKQDKDIVKDFDWDGWEQAAGEALADKARKQFGATLLTRMGTVGQVAFIERLFKGNMTDVLEALPRWSDQLEGAEYDELQEAWEKFLQSRDGF